MSNVLLIILMVVFLLSLIIESKKYTQKEGNSVIMGVLLSLLKFLILIVVSDSIVYTILIAKSLGVIIGILVIVVCDYFYTIVDCKLNLKKYTSSAYLNNFIASMVVVGVVKIILLLAGV